MDTKQTIERYGYVNTRSSAGSPVKLELDPNDIIYVRCWVNYYGNPSYTYAMKNGDVVYLVDDFGAMNGLGRLSQDVVSRKKDLFPSWL